MFAVVSTVQAVHIERMHEKKQKTKTSSQIKENESITVIISTAPLYISLSPSNQNVLLMLISTLKYVCGTRMVLHLFQ